MKKDSEIVFGIRPVIEALNAGRELNKVVIQKGLQGQLHKELMQHLKPHKYLVQHAPIEKLNRITRKNHQGVVAYFSPVKYHQLEDVIDQVYMDGKTPLFLLLDQVTDVRNFGAIARTAECLGVDAIVIPGKGSALITGDALKTSAGALNRIPVCRMRFIKEAITYLQNSGLTVTACTEKTDRHLSEVDFKQPTAIIMGSEEFGISPAYLEMANQKAKIPMIGDTESLNVSVATGMILYETIRQRMAT